MKQKSEDVSCCITRTESRTRALKLDWARANEIFSEVVEFIKISQLWSMEGDLTVV